MGIDMNQLIEIQERLQETTAALARAQRNLIEFPGKPSLLATLNTFEKRQHSLEAEFSCNRKRALARSA